MSAFDWLAEPLSSGLMRRAFAEAALCGAACGVIGCFVMVRRLAFLGESIAHTVVLGAVLAVALGLPLGLGALVLAVVTALLTGAISADRRFSADTATGILLPVLFGAGVALAALTAGQRQLEDLLFGSLLSVEESDLLLAVGLLVALALVLRFAGKELVLIAFDRPSARALGYPVALLDALLLGLLAVMVVVGLRAVGGVLLAGLLLGPPVAARLVCRTFWPMAALAATLGTACGVVGLGLSWHLDVAPGPAIVLTVAATCAFLALIRGVSRAGPALLAATGARAMR